MQKITEEHQRILNVAIETFKEATIKASDKILVIASNEAGLWAMHGNLGDNKIAVQMMKNIIKELEKNIQ